MRALVAAPAAPHGIELRDVPDAAASRPDHVVVGVERTSLNRGEVRRTRAADDGFRPGWDVAGTVVAAAADGSGPPPGTRVVGFARPQESGGSWAERVAVRSSELARIPDDLGAAAGSTLPIAGLTALRTLRHGAPLQGKRVLVTGAAGGVGRLAIQLAAREGADVTAVVGRPERAAGLEALGAAAVAVGSDAAEGEFDVILESAGGASLATGLVRLRPDGVLVSLGNSSGEPTTFRVDQFYFRARARMVGYVIFADGEPSYTADLAYLAALVARGELDVSIAAERSWHEAGSLIDDLLERRIDGKAVLRID
jgi:NADPH:quinone reductase-like Zn-dependent oxidoreductase